MGRGESATVIDAKAGKVVATIALGGKPEFAAVDTKAGRVFNNLEDKSEVVAIDTKTHTVTNRWPIAPARRPFGHGLRCEKSPAVPRLREQADGDDGQHQRQGCRQRADRRRRGRECVRCATQLAFASCGDGTVTIAHEDAPDKLTVVQTLKTTRGARTMTIDPKTHRIYLGAAEYEGAPAQGQRRPKMVAGQLLRFGFGTE